MNEETEKLNQPETPAEPLATPAAVLDADGGDDGADDGADGTVEETVIGPDGQPRKRRRRGRRGGKRHKRKTPGAQQTGGENGAAVLDAAEQTETGSAEPRPQRQPRQRAPRQPRTTEPAAETEEAEAPEDEATGAGGAKTTARRRRRRRKPAGARGTAADGTEAAAEPAATESKTAEPAAPGSTRLAARALRKGQQQKTRRRPRRLTEEDARRLRGAEKTMLIHEHDDRTQIAVLEEGMLIEHFVARKGARTSLAGNVFLGKVQNVLPGMEAAFIDFGRGRNGVLYAGEVNYSAEDLEGELPRIENVLKSGQTIMVQVTKDPLGNKGARLTTQVSLAGRYMVLAPEQQVTGISRRLADNERQRLRQILREISPKEHGVIVRTAADGASKEALERDLQSLLKIWDGIQKARKRAKAPHLLYAEPELTTRVVRDIFSGDFGTVVVDSRGVYEQISSYLEETAPDLLEKVVVHEGPLPLFETYRVIEQLHKALERKVWLPSGGSIVIDRTEAMTVIDVNTGKFTGKGGNLEETVFKNNLEAAEEVARQLRLRDIGGIIVVDFIDMIDPKNQQEVLRTLKRALSRDKTRSQVFEVSALGLVEMTRKKVSEGLLEAFSEPCPNCEGRGIVMTHEID